MFVCTHKNTNMNLTPLTVAVSILLSTSVVLNVAHAKDLFALQPVVSDNTQAKVNADLHPHVDKAFGKVSVDNPQVDSRSLRLRETKKLSLNAVRGWLNSWRDHLTLYFG